MAEFLLGVAKYLLSLVSFTGLIILYDWCDTTKRLQRYVTAYKNHVEFEWKNQPDKFAVMHRVRAYELLLRNLEALRPWTPLASKRVEMVWDEVEYFHREGIPVLREEHLPLPKLGEFPYSPSPEIETYVTNHLLEGLRAIKWLRLEERAGQ